LKRGSLCSLSWHVVCAKPILIEPDIEQKNAKKTGKVKDVFLNRYWAPQSRSFDPQSRASIRKNEKILGEEEIQPCPERKKQAGRPPEALPRDLYSLLWNEPDADHQNGNDEKKQTDRIAMGDE
jgi:hypothetical protein